VLCGNGEVRPEIEAAARELSNVRLLDLQPAGRLNDLLNVADIHLLPQAPGAADLVMPSKLSGMLASGRPVVAASAPGTEVAAVVQGRGIVVPPEDAPALADAIAALAKNRSQRLLLGQAARAYSQQEIDATRVLDRLDAEIRVLVHGNPTPGHPVSGPARPGSFSPPTRPEADSPEAGRAPSCGVVKATVHDRPVTLGD
jgi:colanic acid biosynthesis glycosyl transferase WcaI